MKDYPTSTSQRLQRGSLGFMSTKMRGHVVAVLGEFVGTFLFLLFAYSGTQLGVYGSEANAQLRPNDKEFAALPNSAALLYIAFSWGISLMITVWSFAKISGAMFNPVVSLALCITGGITWFRAIITSIAQCAGAIAAAAVVSAMFPGPLTINTRLGPGVSVAQGIWIEIFMTAMLIFAIYMMAVEKHDANHLAPIGIGFVLFSAEMTSAYFTGGSLNPARSLAPDVVVGFFPHYHWIYWVGPTAGSLIAVAFYKLIKILEYETANLPSEEFADQHGKPTRLDSAAPTTSQSRRPIIGSSQGQDSSYELPYVRSRSQEDRFHRPSDVESGLRK